MNPVILVLAGTGALFLAALGTLALFVIGIRRGDRGHLADAPRSRPDAFARHCLIGIRTDNREARK